MSSTFSSRRSCAGLSFIALPFLACAAGSSYDSSEEVTRTVTAAVTASAEILHITMGEGHMCALLRDSTVRCWGGNFNEQVCDSCGCRAGAGAGGWDSLDRSIPGLEGVTSIVAGESHTCAVIRDGAVRCWGGDQSLIASGSNSPVAAVPGVTDVVQVSTWARETCTLLGNGTVRCFGQGVPPPGDLVNGWFGVEELRSVADGQGNDEFRDGVVFGLTCARRATGDVECRSRAFACDSSRRAVRDSEEHLTFVKGIGRVSSFSSDSQLTCGVDGSGSAKCAILHYRPLDKSHGSCESFFCSRQQLVEKPAVVVGGSGKTIHVATRGGQGCALKEGGGVTCWAITPIYSADVIGMYPASDDCTGTGYTVAGYSTNCNSLTGPVRSIGIGNTCTNIDDTTANVACEELAKNAFVEGAVVGPSAVVRSVAGAREVVMGAYAGSTVCALQNDNGIRCFSLDKSGKAINIKPAFYLPTTLAPR